MRKHLMALCIATSMLVPATTFGAETVVKTEQQVKKENKKKSVERIGGGTAAGAAIGALAGGGKGAAIGALAGGGTGYAYDRHKKKKEKARQQ